MVIYRTIFQMRFYAGFVILAIALSSSGCMENDAHIHINNDGSGSLTQTLLIGTFAFKMMKEMAEMQGKEITEWKEGAEAPSDQLEKFKKKAETMGEGVEFKSATVVKSKDGRWGFKTVYEFKDVNTVKIPTGNTYNPMDSGTGGQRPQGPQSPPVTFKLTPGSPLTLDIDWTGANESMTSENGEKEEEVPSKEDFDEAGEMLKDFAMRFTITIGGVIKDTNAEHVDRKTSTITLMDMHLREITKDYEAYKKFSKAMEEKDTKKARRAIKKLPGILIETKNKVKVSFVPQLKPDKTVDPSDEK